MPIKHLAMRALMDMCLVMEHLAAQLVLLARMRTRTPTRVMLVTLDTFQPTLPRLARCAMAAHMRMRTTRIVLHVHLAPYLKMNRMSAALVLPARMLMGITLCVLHATLDMYLGMHLMHVLSALMEHMPTRQQTRAMPVHLVT